MNKAAHKLELTVAPGRRTHPIAKKPALLLALLMVTGSGASQIVASVSDLPDAPGAVMQAAASAPKPAKLPQCAPTQPNLSPEAASALQAGNIALKPCRPENPLQSVVSTPDVKPLTPGEKFTLAVHEAKDPFNLVVLTAGSGIYIASNAHNPYGPGMKGWGKIEGYNLVQDVQGIFFGTFLIPVVAREDPRYHRMGRGRIARRMLHAALHTYVSQHDNGRLMPNYAVLGNYVIGTELANLWVPGTPVNGPSTAKRIAVGIGLDPAGTMIDEFLPDIARHIHVHSGLLQNILNSIVKGNPNTPP